MVHIWSGLRWLTPRSADVSSRTNKNVTAVYYTGTRTWYLVRSKLLKHGPAMPLKRHVAAPGPINSKRLTARPARECFVSMCACTESVATGIGAVCVECSQPKQPITMLNHTHTNIHAYRGKKKRHPTRSHGPL